MRAGRRPIFGAVGAAFILLVMLACAADNENHLSALDRPAEPWDTPSVGVSSGEIGQPMPTDWRWVSNTPHGQLFYGINENDYLCMLHTTSAVWWGCARMDDLPTYGYNWLPQEGALLYLVIPDGYDQVTVNRELRCHVSNNVTLILNPPPGDLDIEVTGSKGTVNLAIDKLTEGIDESDAPAWCP